MNIIEKKTTKTRFDGAAMVNLEIQQLDGMGIDVIVTLKTACGETAKVVYQYDATGQHEKFKDWGLPHCFNISFLEDDEVLSGGCDGELIARGRDGERDITAEADEIDRIAKNTAYKALVDFVCESQE